MYFLVVKVVLYPPSYSYQFVGMASLFASDLRAGQVNVFYFTPYADVTQSADLF